MPGVTRYAKALLSLAQEQNLTESIGTELARVAEVLVDPILARTLALPNLSPKARKDVAELLIKNIAPSNLLGNFLRVLAENDRLKDFLTIERAYQTRLEQMLGRVRAKIRASTQLNDEELKALVDAFSRLTQKTVIPTVELDPNLLGGVVVEIEGRVYDASLKTQLHRLGETLAQQL